MSSTAETFQAQPATKQDSSWSLWLRQVAAIMRLEVEKNFFGKRAVLVYLLAFMPIGLLLLIAIMPPGTRDWLDFAHYPVLFSGIYNALILRTVIFFGCAWIFMNLFRGETVDRSLHYYFLSSVHREVLFVGVTVISMLLMFFPHFYSASMRFFFEGPGLTQLLTYAGITLLACIGY